MSFPQPRHIALQFGHIKHFNEGLSEVSRQLAGQFASRAAALKEEHGWHFHFIMPQPWHGMFGTEVTYHDLTDRMRWRHRFPVDLDVWHGLHQHMRYAPPINSRRRLITVHDLNHVYAKRSLSLWWQNIRLTRHLRQANQLVAISDFVARDIRHHLPWAPALKVIHNGVTDLSARPQEPIGELAGKDFLLHISRMSPSKNVEALIAMAEQWPEALLVLVGPDSPDITRHRQRVLDRKMPNVRFILDVNEAQKAWLYAHCQAFLFPSLMEGFGLPPIEAMYFGKPVIVARKSCLPEVCGEGALYWDDFSAHAMRKKVEEALRTSHLQRPLQQAARYSWAAAADQYLGLYRE